MKKVRFESPSCVFNNRMDESECHFPRPFIEVPSPRTPPECFERILPYSNDSVLRYENSNSSPYPAVDKLKVPHFNNSNNFKQPEWSPSNDLELSMLDGSTNRLRQPTAYKYKPPDLNYFQENMTKENPRVLTAIQNKNVTPPNVLTKDDDGFFMRRDNLGKFTSDPKPLRNQFHKLSLEKENNPLTKKEEMMNMYKKISPEKIVCPQPFLNDSCRCHHCTKELQNSSPICVPHTRRPNVCCSNENIISPQKFNHCSCLLRSSCCSLCNGHTPPPNICNCKTINKPKSSSQKPLTPQNVVDKRAWALERFGESQDCESKKLEKQTNVTKEKREPTVADLFKIIKLQNEQLQLLQEKVDKFISRSEAAKNKPVQNVLTEQLALQRPDLQTSEQHRISIGVMTSFEMVRTSTVINQEIVQQANDNSQIQCNRSQISVKEVISTSQPVNFKFLEGIVPVEKSINSETPADTKDKTNFSEAKVNDENNDDKTYNEQSLYNLQVENVTTPLISPDQSLFLDVKDYSDSEESIIDHSNVGWTYYNKVMTHVNGLLHDSEMPSSASAMYKNTRQQCMQMQIDKTNLSIMKRVKFGDDPFGIHQPHIYAATTDTSLKMNQLAAKYLKPVQQQFVRPANKDGDMTTKKYMESRKLLTGIQTQVGELPKFLDITALKQQTKLL